MPLLVSPIDGTTPMQQIIRNGIEIDLCPVSGGVWLDRGELEKLLNAMMDAYHEDRDEYATYAKQQPAIQKPTSSSAQPIVMQHTREYYRREDDYDNYYKKKYHKKSKIKSFLDIFDFD
jgi:Zn-finger nucleic acid-binding protein